MVHGHGNLLNHTKNNKVLKLKSKNFYAGLDVLFPTRGAVFAVGFSTRVVSSAPRRTNDKC